MLYVIGHRNIAAPSNSPRYFPKLRKTLPLIIEQYHMFFSEVPELFKLGLLVHNRFRRDEYKQLVMGYRSEMNERPEI